MTAISHTDVNLVVVPKRMDWDAFLHDLDEDDDFDTVSDFFDKRIGFLDAPLSTGEHFQIAFGEPSYIIVVKNRCFDKAKDRLRKHVIF
jgi:hypothetical protein